MLILNASDEQLSVQLSTKPPIYANGEEYVMMPSIYDFPSGEVIEVPDEVGTHALTERGARGLIRVQMQSDLKAAAREAKVKMLEFYRAQLKTWHAQQDDRVTRGLPREFRTPEQVSSSAAKVWKLEEELGVRHTVERPEQLLEPSVFVRDTEELQQKQLGMPTPQQAKRQPVRPEA